MKNLLPVGVFWGVVALATLYSAREPELNWDGIAYVALALERNGATQEDAHVHAYQYLEELASAERLFELTRSSPYRERMLEDSAAFSETLNFYRMRRGYVGLLAGATKLSGGNPFLVAVGVGAGAFLLLSWALWMWIGEASLAARRRWEEDPTIAVSTGWERLLPLCLLLQPAVLAGTSLSTPDFLAASLLVCGAYLLFCRKETVGSAFFFLLAALSRPDSILLSCPLLASPTFGSRASPFFRLVPILLSAALGLFTFVQVSLSGAHPWSTVFHHTFIQHLEMPTAEAITIDVWEYASVVGTAIVYLGSGKHAKLLFCVALLVVGYLVWHPLVEKERKFVAITCLASWVAFFFVFPLPLERFYVAHFVVVGALLLHSLVDFHAAAEKTSDEKWIVFLGFLRGRSPTGRRLALPQAG